MQFHDHNTKPKTGHAIIQISKQELEQIDDKHQLLQLQHQKAQVPYEAQQDWIDIRRPYYNIWPCIIPQFIKLNLDFPGRLLTPPNGLNHLLLRLPKTNHQLQSIGTILLSFRNNAEISTTLTTTDNRTRAVAISRDYLHV